MFHVKHLPNITRIDIVVSCEFCVMQADRKLKTKQRIFWNLEYDI